MGSPLRDSGERFFAPTFRSPPIYANPVPKPFYPPKRPFSLLSTPKIAQLVQTKYCTCKLSIAQQAQKNPEIRFVSPDSSNGLEICKYHAGGNPLNCWRSHARFTRLHTSLPDLDRGKACLELVEGMPRDIVKCYYPDKSMGCLLSNWVWIYLLVITIFNIIQIDVICELVGRP